MIIKAASFKPSDEKDIQIDEFVLVQKNFCSFCNYRLLMKEEETI